MDVIKVKECIFLKQHTLNLLDRENNKYSILRLLFFNL